MKQFSIQKKIKKSLIQEPSLSITNTKNKEKTYSNELEINQEQKFNQKLSLHSVQRHHSLLKFEETLLIMTFITAGVLGRILLQGFPSVEPITFFAILAGSLFGWRKGAITGASSWYLSNFFMFGGQGPWTIIHIASGLMAGALGGLFLKKPNYIKSISIMVLVTLIFEVLINTMSGLLFYGLIISFLTAIPFTIIHLTSNVAFSLLIPKTRKTIFEKGKLNEKELCQKFIAKLKKLKPKRDDSNNES